MVLIIIHVPKLGHIFVNFVSKMSKTAQNRPFLANFWAFFTINHPKNTSKSQKADEGGSGQLTRDISGTLKPYGNADRPQRLPAILETFFKNLRNCKGGPYVNIRISWDLDG